MLSVYSALFTYHSDSEKNNDILKNALRTSKRLGQMLSNMQDGMRSYFDDLSGMKKFYRNPEGACRGDKQQRQP